MADELFQASTSQLSFEKFINTINQEQARDLVRRINQFMKEFNKRTPDSETDAREVQNFLTTMELAFSRHPLWTGSTRTELDNAVEGLEKYLMTKLYDRTFAADPLDRERDAVLSRRLTALAGFVAPAHLEVSTALAGPLAADENGQLAAAERELRRMHLYKSPRDKLVQILNCCKIINTLINSKRAGAGADDFTPTLIYVTIKAQPEALASNLAFIERYRHGPRLNGEASYFFVQMQGAVAFLETLTTSSLAGCDPDEFISHMLAAGAMSEAELSEEQLAVQRQRAAAAVALPPPSRPLQLTQSRGKAAAAVAAVPPSAGPGSAAASAAPVYGNPMLSGARQPPPPPPQQQPYVATTGVYGSGTPLPPPPPPPLSTLPQQQPYFLYPSTNTGPPPYNQMVMAPYYGQVPYSVQQGPIMSYGEAWSPAQLQQSGMVALPPPPPPPPLSTPPPLGSAPAAAAAAGPVTSSPLAPAQPPTAAQSIPPPPKSVAELEADGIRLVVRAEAAGELRARYRYLYTSPEALSLREVSQLLAAYKELVLRYETLAQAVENNVLKYYSELEAYQAGLRSTPPGTTVTTVPAVSTVAAPPPPPPLLPHQPPYNAGIRTVPAPLPSSPPAPQQVVSPATQQPPPPPSHEESELVSKRGTPPPPPPPAASIPLPLPASGPSGGGAAAAMSPRRTVDLSQFMPDYQLLTEGYAFGAIAPPERGTTSTTVAAAAAAVFPPPPEAAASSASYQGSSSLMAMNDLLGDEGQPPPPPPPPPPHVLLDQIAPPALSTTGPSAAAAGTGAAPASPGAAVAATGSATTEAALHAQTWTPQAGVPEPVLSSSTSNGNHSVGPLEREGWQANQQQQDEAGCTGLQHLQQEEEQRQQQHQPQQNIVFLTLAPNSNQLTATEDVQVSISGTGPGQDGACAATPSGGGGSVAAALLAADPPTDDDDRQLTLTLTPPGSSLARSDADLVALASLNNPPVGGGAGEGDGGDGGRVEAGWGSASSAAAAPVDGDPSAAAATDTAGGILEPFSAAPSTSAAHMSEDRGSFIPVAGTSSCLEGTSSATVGVVMPLQPPLSASLAIPMSERPSVEADAALQEEEASALVSKSDVGGGVVLTASHTVGHGGEEAFSSGHGVGSIHVPAADSHPAGMQCGYNDHTLGVERGAVNVTSSEEAGALLTSAAAVAGPVGDPAVAPLVEAQTDLEPQTEAERQARVDELLQQLLGTAGDGVEVSSRGGMMEDTAAYDAASLDATLALYSAGAVGGLAEGIEVGPSDNPLLGDMIDAMTGAAVAALAPPSQEGTTNIVPQGGSCKAVGVASMAAAPSEAGADGDRADDEQSLFVGLYVQN